MSNLYNREEVLYHHGIKGQKWGIRRYQNVDGSYTAQGRSENNGHGRYSDTDNESSRSSGSRSKMMNAKAKYKADSKAYSKAFDRATGVGQYFRHLTKKGRAENDRRTKELIKTAYKANKSEDAYKQAKKEYKQSDEYKARQEKMKKAAKIGLAVAGTALAAYGAYKMSQVVKDKAWNVSFNKGKAYADSRFDFNYPIGQTNFKNGNFELTNKYGDKITTGTYKKQSYFNDFTPLRNRQNAVYEDYSREMKEVVKDADAVSKNTLSAIKYLRKNRK